MANLNFPPTSGQPTDGSFQYTDANNGVIYSWDGYKWQANSGSSLNTMYVQVAGDNMTGDLTLGTDKITLNATDGIAGFGGATPSTGRTIELNSKNSAGLRIKNNTGAASGAYINLWDTSIDPSAGNATFGSETNDFVFKNQLNGVSQPTREVGRLTNTGDFLVGGTLPSAPNIELNADGSASFAKTLDVGTYSPSSTEARGLRAYIDDNKLNLGIQCKSGQGGTNDALNVREGNALKYSIKYNGTATHG